MKRYLYDQILKDLERKMVFITGPRQVGKTYLSKQIAQEFSKSQYLNFDNMNERKIINEMTWKKNIDLLILDEIHKKMDWKLFLKGIFDSRQENLRILVTGSARLETFRQSGESLAGRYLHLRLNPFSVKELSGELSTYETIEKLNKIGGFPEPLLYSLNENEDESIEFAARWSKQYYIDLIREDIIEFSRIHEISAMKLLVELLRSKVGSPISYKNIAEDLEVSPNTIKKYIKILESLYIVFLVHPYHKNIARAILKEPKVYFYDTSFVKGNEGILFENTCAVSLLKNVQYLFDARGKEIGLHYL
ncbi:MAG: ATP-binding protein, partial [Ignavibacteriae bacterium]|nr:ATP-binding protein [Ignavibacteriota bacterium]